MAVLKDKVVAKLNEKYKARLSQNFKNKLAEKYAEKIDTDEDIDSYIDDRDDIILETISESDRRAKQASDKAKEDAAKAIKGDVVEPEEPNIPDDVPAWAKLLIESNNNLKSEIDGFKNAKSQETIAERFKKTEGFDKIPEKILSRFIPKTEEEFETNKVELSETWNSLNVENKSRGFGADRPSGNTTAVGAAKTDEPTKESVDAVLAKLNI